MQTALPKYSYLLLLFLLFSLNLFSPAEEAREILQTFRGVDAYITDEKLEELTGYLQSKLKPNWYTGYEINEGVYELRDSISAALGWEMDMVEYFNGEVNGKKGELGEVEGAVFKFCLSHALFLSSPEDVRNKAVCSFAAATGIIGLRNVSFGRTSKLTEEEKERVMQFSNALADKLSPAANYLQKYLQSITDSFIVKGKSFPEQLRCISEQLHASSDVFETIALYNWLRCNVTAEGLFGQQLTSLQRVYDCEKLFRTHVLKEIQDLQLEKDCLGMLRSRATMFFSNADMEGAIPGLWIKALLHGFANSKNIMQYCICYPDDLLRVHRNLQIKDEEMSLRETRRAVKAYMLADYYEKNGPGCWFATDIVLDDVAGTVESKSASIYPLIQRPVLKTFKAEIEGVYNQFKRYGVPELPDVLLWGVKGFSYKYHSSESFPETVMEPCWDIDLNLPFDCTKEGISELFKEKGKIFLNGLKDEIGAAVTPENAHEHFSPRIFVHYPSTVFKACLLKQICSKTGYIYGPRPYPVIVCLPASDAKPDKYMVGLVHKDAILSANIMGEPWGNENRIWNFAECISSPEIMEYNSQIAKNYTLESGTLHKQWLADNEILAKILSGELPYTAGLEHGWEIFLPDEEYEGYRPLGEEIHKPAEGNF